MEIIWNKNPLRTQIMLTEHEKKEYWLKIKIEELQELMTSAYFDLEDDKKYFSVEKARKELDPAYFCANWTDETKGGEKSGLDERVDQMFGYYIDELENNSHCGDCTCVACRCSKCHAESLLGIDTTKGLGKHSAYKVDGAFGKDNERTIEEAIQSLATYDPGIPWKGAEAYVPRWNTEAAVACEWLKAYKLAHFS